MKICQVTSMHDWDDDRIYQRACLGLAQLNHEVHLVAQRNDKQPENSPVHFHWITPRTGGRRRILSSKEAVKLAITVGADIYHFHDPDLLPHVVKIKKALPNAKVIYDIHENYVSRFDSRGILSAFGGQFRSFEQSIINKIDGATVVSESMKDLFQKVTKPIEVVRNSVDVSRLMSLDLSDDSKFDVPTIYTSGSNSHARQCLQSVQAMGYMSKEVNYQMMFVGKYLGGIENELEVQAKSDNTFDKLKLEGMLPWAENFKRTKKASIGCVFYEDNANNRVGIPNRIFEYMFCGLPIVATNFPELVNVVEKAQCGILVDSSKPEEIAKAFTFLLKNPQEAVEMGKRGKEAINNEFGYHNDLKRMETFYSKLLN